MRGQEVSSLIGLLSGEYPVHQIVEHSCILWVMLMEIPGRDSICLRHLISLLHALRQIPEAFHLRPAQNVFGLCI